MEGNLRLKIDWATLIVGRKFTVFGLFYFVFEGNFQVQAPRGAYIWRGLYMEGVYFRKFTVFTNDPHFQIFLPYVPCYFHTVLSLFYGAPTNTYGHFRGHINPRTFTQIHTPAVVENYSGTVYAVIYEVVNAKNQSEPLGEQISLSRSDYNVAFSVILVSNPTTGGKGRDGTPSQSF